MTTPMQNEFTPTELETRLRALGVQSDAEAGSPEPAEETRDGATRAASPAAPAGPEEPSDAPAAARQPAAGAQPSTTSESAASAAADDLPPAAAASGRQPETPYEEARREGREREARAWQKIEEEKARLRQERESLEAARTQPPAGKPAGEEGIQPEWEARKRAELEASPELQEPASPLGEAVQAILLQDRSYLESPDGFRQAVILARARQEAAALPALQTRIAALTKENERLVRLTSVTGTPPPRVGGEEAHRFSERDLRRLAAEMDASGGER